MNRLFPTFLLTAVVSLLFVFCSSDDDNSVTEKEEETSETTDYDISSLLSKFEGTGLSYAVNGTTVVFSTQDLPNHTSPYWPSTRIKRILELQPRKDGRFRRKTREFDVFYQST